MSRSSRFRLVAVQLGRRLIERRRRPVAAGGERGLPAGRTAKAVGRHWAKGLASSCCRGDGASRCATTWTVRWGLPLVLVLRGLDARPGIRDSQL